MPELNRRHFVLGATAAISVGLAGCQSNSRPGPSAQLVPAAPTASSFATMYAPITTDEFPIPGILPSELNAAFVRKLVVYPSREPVGTIVIDPTAHYLYSIRSNGMAMRYGVGVGRQGFSWSGDATIEAKRIWPDWYPPQEMVERQPELKNIMTKLQSGEGVAGGPKNPLGARALYLYQNNKDTLYRIHGTFQPWTIGKSVSSGCIRMTNQDVIDLYNHTPMNTRVVVLGNGSALA